MAEEFQTGICSGNWWNSSRSAFTGGSSPCSLALNETVGYSWLDMVKERSCEETNSVTDSSIPFQDVQKPQQQADSATGGGNNNISIDSTLQMMGFGLSDLNQALLRGSGRAESNYNSMLQEEMNPRLNYQQERGTDSCQIQKNWSPKNFSNGGDQDSSSIAGYKPTNQDFSLDTVSSTGNYTVTFPMGSAALYGYPSTVQSLFDADLQPQQSPFNDRSVSYSSSANYATNSNELSASWSKFSPFSRPSSLPKQQTTGLHFSNNTPFWNASAATLNDIRAGAFPSSQQQYLVPTFEEKPKCPNLTTKPNFEDVQDSVSVVKKSGSTEPAFKRPRIETPSPLPTFKVRKEKLGDRITALQQLVSPFGKTDTASVLHEAIEYIKFLHDQVLSTPYMKNGTPIQHQQGSEKPKEEGPKQDLRSRGLCLVPTSSTYPMANESTTEFWTPTFGGTFR